MSRKGFVLTFFMLVLTIIHGAEDRGVGCTLCRSFFWKLYDITTSPKTLEILKPGIKWICAQIKHKDYCDHAIDVFGPVLNILGMYFNATIRCSSLGFCDSPRIVIDSDDKFTKRVLRDKPLIPVPIPRNQSTPLKILVFTDPHMDFQYKEGASTRCDYGLCCRTGHPEDQRLRAGRYGNGGCDLPNITVDSFVNETIRQNPDMVFWLGDNAPHNTYEQTKETQVDYFTRVTKLFKAGGYKGKVYAVLGNHDSFPAGQFDIFRQEHKWLTEAYARELETWYTPQATKMFREYGVFSMLHPGTNLRIIGMNLYYAHQVNLYKVTNSTDPYGMFQWLKNELRDSERQRESVMILGHVAPNGRESSDTWTYRYSVLVERYAHIIRGQFFGHMHSDYFFITRSQDKREPIAVSFQHPPLTTRPNPSFRVYDVDRETYIPLDYYQYRLYLDEANRKLEAEWKIAYRFLDYFQVTDMSPKSYDKVIQRLEKDEEYFLKIYKQAKQEGHGGAPSDHDRKIFFCYLKTWSMREFEVCVMKFGAFKDFSKYFLMNHFLIGNWTHLEP